MFFQFLNASYKLKCITGCHNLKKRQIELDLKKIPRELVMVKVNS